MKISTSLLTAVISAMMVISSCSSEKTTLRLATYNVGVFQKYVENSTGMVADMMKELGIDIISLNELDSVTTRTGELDQLAEFAAAMGEEWDYRFGRAIPFRGGAYGVGIAASPEYKITSSHIVPLGQFDGSEPRTMMVIETEKFIFATTHLDYKSVSAQNNQAEFLTSWMKEKYGKCGKPVILCGDFNATPEAEVIAILKKDWTMISKEINSFPSTDADRCIDYIMILNNGAEYEVNDTYVPTEFESGDVKLASDHLPVFAEIELK